MRISKGRFALLSVTSIGTCLTSYFVFISSGLPDIAVAAIADTVNLDFEVTENSDFVVAFAGFVSVGVAIVIMSITKHAISNWEGAPRVSEIELAKNGLDNSILVLTASQIKLIATRTKDPIASERLRYVDHASRTPEPLEERILLRDLFLSSYHEAAIADDGWRDTLKLWVGRIHLESDGMGEHLVLYVFDEEPTAKSVIDKINQSSDLLDRIDQPRLYGVYRSSSDSTSQETSVGFGEGSVHLLGSKHLLYNSLNLRGYARALKHRFSTTRAGGTDATTENSYVEMRAAYPYQLGYEEQVVEELRKWEQENSSRHLAITGQYGQGKSTVMLKYCCDWADRFLSNETLNERVPLLIELRGRNPSELDPLAFVSTWSARYGLQPSQVLNLIKSGGATIIFEGFDELLNSGRLYDRYSHFNALWRFAYPGVKVVFTGRPNFFLDDSEANRTLRTNSGKGAANEIYTDILRLQMLNIVEIDEACRSFKAEVREGILKAANENYDFFEIVSRPSMLPVVATIWDDIESLRQSGGELTGALLIDRYLNAIYSRKEAELERDRIIDNAPEESRYLSLPRPVRELFTICISLRIVSLSKKNTISREEITTLVTDLYSDVFLLVKSKGVAPDVVEGMSRFEKRHSEDSQADIIESITSELCSSSLLVPDPAAGSSNLQFPHKQFLEYLVCKGFCLQFFCKNLELKSLFKTAGPRDGRFSALIREPSSIKYLIECADEDFLLIWSPFQLKWFYFLIALIFGFYQIAAKLSSMSGAVFGTAGSAGSKIEKLVEALAEGGNFKEHSAAILNGAGVAFGCSILFVAVVEFGKLDLKSFIPSLIILSVLIFAPFAGRSLVGDRLFSVLAYVECLDVVVGKSEAVDSKLVKGRLKAIHYEALRNASHVRYGKSQISSSVAMKSHIELAESLGGTNL